MTFCFSQPCFIAHLLVTQQLKKCLLTQLYNGLILCTRGQIHVFNLMDNILGGLGFRGNRLVLFLFNMCGDFITNDKKNKGIKDMKSKDFDILVCLFAEDTTLYLNGSEESFTEANCMDRKHKEL